MVLETKPEMKFSGAPQTGILRISKNTGVFSRDDAKKLVDVRSVQSDAALVLEGQRWQDVFLAQTLQEDANFS